MEQLELVAKLLVGLVSVGGVVAAHRFNASKAQKLRAELIKQLEEALEREQKYSVAELFYMLHGRRMTYDDILSVTRDNRSAHILYALKKTPGMVKYEGGRFLFTQAFSKSWVRSSFKYVARGVATLLGIVTLALIVMFALAEGATAMAVLFLLIPCCAFLVMQLRELRYDEFVKEIVGNRAQHIHTINQTQ